MNRQIVKLGKVAITVDKNYWAITKDYDRLVMVKRQSTGVVYISRKPVPAGIEITNRDYWLSFNIGGADSTTVVNLVQEFGGDPEVAISQKVITEKIEEIEAAIASIDSNSGGHNILPFDGFDSYPIFEDAISEQPYNLYIGDSPQPVQYAIVSFLSLTGNQIFYLKVGDTYYTTWVISTGTSSDSATDLRVISSSAWYNESRENKLFYNKSNKAIYAYDYATMGLIPITNIQVVEANAPEAESTLNPDNATKGSIVVDLEHDKLITWDGNKWKELSGGGSIPVDVPNSIAIRNRILYLEKVSTGSEPVVFASVELPAGGGQTVVVQSNEDSPSIVRLDANTSKLGKKVIPLGTSVANLFKNGVRENDSDVYDQTTYSSDDGTYTVYHIKYEFDLNNGSVTVPEKSILKFEGGCLKNGTLVGNNTKVEVDGTYTIFDNISFSGTFRDSSLYATNFGAAPDMESVLQTNFSYKNLQLSEIKVRTGTNNYNVFSKVAQFLKNSDRITLNFNGSFYSVGGYHGKIEVKYAKNLAMKGGTATVGWYFIGCRNVLLEDYNCVGLHEIHDFPTLVWATNGLYDIYTQDDLTFAYDNAHIQQVPSNVTFSSGEINDVAQFGCALGIYFQSEDDYTVSNDSECAEGFVARNCHFEMCSGLSLGLSGKTASTINIVKNCIVENCTFDHNTNHAVVIHGDHISVRNCRINYAMSPFDISTGCAYCTFENIKATSCGDGIKQDNVLAFTNTKFCGKNVVSNLDYTFDSVYPTKHKNISDIEYYVIKCERGTDDTPFIIKDSVFRLSRVEETITPTVDRVVNGTTYHYENPQSVGRNSVTTIIQSTGGRINIVNCKFIVENVIYLAKFPATSNSVVDITNSYIDIQNLKSYALVKSTSGTALPSTSKIRFTNCEVNIAVPPATDSNNNYLSGKEFNYNPSTDFIIVTDFINCNINLSRLYNIRLYENSNVIGNNIKLNYKGGTFLIYGKVNIQNNVITNTYDDVTNTGDSVNSISVFTFKKIPSDGSIISKNIISCGGFILRADDTTSGSNVGITNLLFEKNIISCNTSATAELIHETNGYISGLVDNAPRNNKFIGNVFTGSATSPVISVNSAGQFFNNTVKGNIVNPLSKNTLANIPDADVVGQDATFYDTTNNRLLISDGVQWIPIDGSSSEETPVEPEPTVPTYGPAEDIPETAQLGATYFDTDNNVMKVYNGSQWVNSEQRIIPLMTISSYDSEDAQSLANNSIVRIQSNSILEMKLRGNDYRTVPVDENECITVTLESDFERTTENNLGIYYSTSSNKYYIYYNNGSSDVNKGLYTIPVNTVALSSGTFNNAPDINEVVLGYTYYDTVRQKLLTAKSEGWTDNDGNVITVLTKGTTSQRPAVTDITEGFKYYNTQIHKEQVYNGTTWVDIEDAASTGIRIDSLVPDVVTGSALSTTLAADINKYYRYDSPVDTLAVTLPELVSSSKVQNVVVYLTAGSNADSTTITFTAATPTEGVAAPVYYQKSYDIEAGKTYEINALYNGAAWIVAAVEIVTAVAQSSNSNNNSLLMGGFTPLDNNSDNTETPDVEPDNTETV